MLPSELLSETKRKLLEKYERGLLAKSQPVANTVRRRPPGAFAPLSLGQEQIWLHAEPGLAVPAAFNESITIHHHGRLDIAVLERCLSEIIRRHEAWRTTFDLVQDRVVQIVHAAPLGALDIADLHSIPEAEREHEARRLASEQAQQPFDLRRGPLVRAILVSLDDESQRLCLTMHQSVVDGVSVYQILPGELARLYEAFSTGKPSPLPELPIQYGDFACWERRWLRGDVLERQLGYWRERLSGELRGLSWPADRPRPPFETFRGAIRPFTWPEELRASLKELSQREGGTLFMVLAAAFAALLHRYTKQEDMIIGTFAPAGRKWPEAQGLLGYFLNSVPLRINVSSNSTFRELLAQVRRVVSEALSHDDAPFEHVVDELKLKRDPSRHPVFQIMISLAPSLADLDPAWDQTFMDVESGGAKWDLYLELSERQQGIIGRAQYNPDLFEAATITRMLEHWEALLKGIAAFPNRPIASAPLLTEDEKHQLLVAWNNTKQDYPGNIPVHEVIETQVERSPDAVAIVYKDRHMSYRLLDARANQLGHYLRKRGAGPGTLVGVCVPRSPELVMALLGAWKSGSACVPLDPGYAASRLSLMVEDAGIRVLVTQRARQTKLSGFRGELVCLDRDWEAICRESVDNAISEAKPEDPACVVYTPGASGKLVGVEISHRSVVNFLLSMQANPGFTALDTFLAATSSSPASTALELYVPLICGGRLVLVSRETATNGSRLQEVLARTAPTVMQAPPATWRLLLESGWSGSNSLKILCGGKSMPLDLVRELVKCGSSVWNMYGSPETTLWSVMARLTSGGDPVTVGRPIANTQVYILDSLLEPVPMGTCGELYIGGDSLARGYWRRPKLTAANFIPNPFSDASSQARLFRTGDLARYRPSGEIECLGRAAHHVQVCGLKVDLGEVESVLSGHPTVDQAIAWTHTDVSGEKQLVAYIVAIPGTPCSVQELREFLRQRMPEYMVPSSFTFLESLPLMPNGMVDRRALPRPAPPETTDQMLRASPHRSIDGQAVAMWKKLRSLLRPSPQVKSASRLSQGPEFRRPS